MNKMIVIREAEKNEATNLSRLAMRSKTYWGYSEEFMEACRQELSVSADKIESNDYHYAVAENQGVIVGFYALGNLSDSNIELEALFAEPKYIGSGIGRVLIEHAKESRGGQRRAYIIFSR